MSIDSGTLVKKSTLSSLSAPLGGSYVILSPPAPDLRSIIIALVQHLESTFRQCPTIDHIPYFSIQLCSTPRSLLLLPICFRNVPIGSRDGGGAQRGRSRSGEVVLDYIQRALSVTFGRNGAAKQRITKPDIPEFGGCSHDKVHNQPSQCI